MKRGRWPWLMAAGGLLGIAAWLMALRDVDPPAPAWRRAEMPRRMTGQERARAESRRTLPPPPVVSPAAEPAPLRDPLIAALPPTVKRGVVVVEANAVRHSPVGQLLVDCMLAGDGARSLEELRRLTGIDPLEDVDRVAMTDDTLIVSGHFAKARWQEIFAQQGVGYGQDGMLYRPATSDDTEAAGIAIGVWKGQLVVAAPTEDAVRATLDRLEGRGTQGPPALDESQTYGEIYGVVNGAAIAQLVPPEQAALAEKLRAAAARVELHVDTQRDVGIVANVTGPLARDNEDLGKSIGAALALGRLRAQAEGEGDLAELMDLARVVPEDGRFRIEMGLPLELLEKHLRSCVEINERRRAERSPQTPEDPRRNQPR
jgi:hypothetical protein